MKCLLTFLLTIIASTILYAQGTDSLINLLPNKNNSEKLDILIDISDNYRSSNIDTLLFYTDMAIELSDKLNNNNKRGIALKNKGTILYIKGDISNSMMAYDQAIKLFENANNMVEIANVLNNKSTLHLQKGDIQEAIKVLKLSLKIYNETGNQKHSCPSLINMGRIYFRTGDYLLAESVFNEAIKIANSTNNTKRAIEATSNLAVVYNEWGEYYKALTYYESTIEMCNKTNDLRTTSVAYFNIGDIYFEIGNTTHAIDFTLKALEIKRNLKLDNEIPGILNQLGNIYSKSNKSEMALNYFSDALSMAKEFNNKFETGYALCGMAQVFSNTEIYTKTLDYFNEALKTFEEINSKKEVAETNTKIGNIYLEKLNNTTEAKSFYDIAYRIFKQINSNKGLADVYTSYGKCCLNDHEYNKATAYFQKSINLSLNNYQSQVKNYILLSESLAYQNKHNNANAALKKALTYKDSILLNSTQVENQKIEIEYKIQKKEQEFAYLIRQNELNTLLLTKKRNMQFLLLTIILLLIVIIGLGLFFYKKLKAINADLLLKQEQIEHQKNDLESKNEQLNKANIEAHKLSDFKSQFLANISHEIRTPLNAIAGYAKLLSGNLQQESDTYQINQVIQATENMMIIINDLLDFSKIEAGKMVIERIPFQPVEVITNSIATLKFKAEKKNIQLEIHIDPFIPKTIKGDPHRLSQVLINLIGNAIKYSNDGQVVTIESRCENKEGVCSMHFAITDHGVGIPEKKLATIFETFTQIHSDTARLYEGTGLGLSIVKRLIELQKGQIQVKSKVNKGSVFSFTIDYKIEQEEKKGQNLSAAEPNKIKFANEHSILLVEDNIINQELAKDTIISWGESFNIDVSENGKDAIIAVQEKDYSVILMDIQMPIMDGHEATQYIRNSLPAPKCNTPIIGMTAHAMSSEKELALKNGMNEYLTKPFNPEELKQKMFFFIKQKEK